MKEEDISLRDERILLAITSWADDKEKDEDRLKNAGTVLTEILNLPMTFLKISSIKPIVWLFFHRSSRPAFVVGGSYGPRCDDVPQGREFQRLLGRAPR